ncbi:hypothetical protein WKI65_33215 [Streptomyces sp. MS1.AVA.3]
MGVVGGGGLDGCTQQIDGFMHICRIPDPLESVPQRVPQAGQHHRSVRVVGGDGLDGGPPGDDGVVQVRQHPTALKPRSQCGPQIVQVREPHGVVGGDGVRDAPTQVHGGGEQAWFGGDCLLDQGGGLRARSVGKLRQEGFGQAADIGEKAGSERFHRSV